MYLFLDINVVILVLKFLQQCFKFNLKPENLAFLLPTSHHSSFFECIEALNATLQEPFMAVILRLRRGKRMHEIILFMMQTAARGHKL